MKLLWKILIPIAFLIAFLVGVSGYVAFKQSSASLGHAVIANMEDEANSLRRITSSILSNSRQNVERVSKEPAINAFYEGDIQNKSRQLELADQLAIMVDTYQDIDRINVFDGNGAIVSSSNPKVIGEDFSTRPYFIEAMKGRTFVSEPFKSNITQQGVIIISTPVYRGGNVAGVVNATIPLPAYFEIAIAPVGIGEKGYAYAMDRAGRIVMHKNAEVLFRDDLPDSAVYREMASSPDGATFFADAAGRDSFAYHVQEPLSGMTLVVQSEREDVFASLDELSRMTLLVVIVSILLGAVVLFALVRPIVAALNMGVLFAADVAAGRLDGTLGVQRKDEIGILADALRSIPMSLKSVTAEYARLEGELEAGAIEVQGDPSKFPGDFGKLVSGANNMLKLYQTILKSLTSPVLVMDRNLRIVYVNDAAKALAGTECLGKTCGEVLAREDDGTPQCATKKAVSTLRPASAQTVAHPRGRRMDIEYTSIPFTGKDGELDIVLQLITDLTEIKDTQRVIIDVATQAGEISTRLAAASEQLSAQVTQVSSGAEVQRERASSTAAAMEEMNSTVLEVARSAGAASQQADSTNKKATEGSTLVQQVVEAINKVNAVSLEVDANMRELGEQTESIGSVLSVISDIADQTNLLALNAAIEAARAGEAGRGFAVVADEVRKLAEKTMLATTEVESKIMGIQTATSTNIERVSLVAESASKANGLAGVSGNALEEILNLANSTSVLISSIATAAEEQSSTSEEINLSIEEINRIAEETASGMQESALSVQDVSRMAQELKVLLDKLQQ